mgnify:CR=1 FL=1
MDTCVPELIDMQLHMHIHTITRDIFYVHTFSTYFGEPSEQD